MGAMERPENPANRGRDLTEDLRLAHMLADNVDSITMSRFKAQDLEVRTKPDLTPVTDADRAAEESIRSTLSRARARDGIVGEEFGGSLSRSGRQWVVDPIDGTKNFVRGVPVWATLIALLVGAGAANGHGAPYFVLSCGGAAAHFAWQFASWAPDVPADGGRKFNVRRGSCCLAVARR